MRREPRGSGFPGGAWEPVGDACERFPALPTFPLGKRFLANRKPRAPKELRLSAGGRMPLQKSEKGSAEGRKR